MTKRDTPEFKVHIQHDLDEIKRLQAVNSALLAALKGIVDLVPTDCQAEARAAIAKGATH